MSRWWSVARSWSERERERETERERDRQTDRQTDILEKFHITCIKQIAIESILVSLTPSVKVKQQCLPKQALKKHNTAVF